MLSSRNGKRIKNTTKNLIFSVIHFFHGGLMTVYIEYVLINNFVIDFLILKTTSFLRARKTKTIKTILGGIFGASVSLFYPLIETHSLLLVALKFLVACFIVLISLQNKSARDFYINLTLFLFTTFFYLGVTTGVLTLLNIDYKKEIFIALSSLPIYFFSKGIVTVINYLKNKTKERGFYYDCELTYKNKTLKLAGFLDTGNSLYYQGEPVIIIDKKVFSKLIDKEFPKTFYINFQSVGEKKKIPSFRVDRLKIYNGNLENIIDNVIVGVATVGINYDIILHSNLVGGDYAKPISGQVEKVS